VRLEHDTIILDSGRTEYAHQEIVGIGPDLDISYGYDGGINLDGNYLTREGAWSTDEKVELADYMIDLWNQFKEKARRENLSNPRV
jgi:hypothetical protein